MILKCQQSNKINCRSKNRIKDQINTNLKKKILKGATVKITPIQKNIKMTIKTIKYKFKTSKTV